MKIKTIIKKKTITKRRVSLDVEEWNANKKLNFFCFLFTKKKTQSHTFQKIQLQSTNAFSATKYALDAKSSNPSVTKYASVSNGTLANGSTGLLNTNSMNTLTGVVNGNGSASGSIATNLMRSLLTSSNKQNTTRGYFNHISSLNTNNNNSNTNGNNNMSNTSINNLTLNANTNSNSNTNNIFVDNELSAYSLLPSESHKGNLNNTLNISTINNLNTTSNGSIITATMPIHQHTRHVNNNSNSNMNQLTSREKTHAQISSNNSNQQSGLGNGNKSN